MKEIRGNDLKYVSGFSLVLLVFNWFTVEFFISHFVLTIVDITFQKKIRAISHQLGTSEDSIKRKREKDVMFMQIRLIADILNAYIFFLKATNLNLVSRFI